MHPLYLTHSALDRHAESSREIAGTVSREDLAAALSGVQTGMRGSASAVTATAAAAGLQREIDAWARATHRHADAVTGSSAAFRATDDHSAGLYKLNL